MAQILTLVLKGSYLTILSLSIIFNSLGIYLLSLNSRSPQSQTILIMNLSAVELFVAATSIIDCVLIISGMTIVEDEVIVLGVVLSGAYIVWYFAMYLITVDRLLGSLFPIKHHILFSTRGLVKPILLTWLIGIPLGLIRIISQKVNSSFELYVWLPLGGILLLLCAVTYGTIFAKLVMSKRLARASMRQTGEVSRRNPVPWMSSFC